MAGAGLVFCGVLSTYSAEGTKQLVSEVDKSIAIATLAVDEARSAIEGGKVFLAQIPADSELKNEVKAMLVSAAENWKVAVAALEGAKQSASRIPEAKSQEIAKDYGLLATVNARVAVSGANVVQTGMFFVEAAAGNKTESLDIIRMAMQDALAAASQVEFNYERVKTLIEGKYSK